MTLWMLRIGDGLDSKIHLVSWLYFPCRTKDITISFKAFNRSITLTLPNNRDQIMTLRGVFLGKDWDIHIDNEPATIFDLGSYTGISVAYFFLKYPDAVIHAFEPNPESFQYLSRNFAGVSRVFCHNSAVSDHNGTVDLFTPNDRPLSSSLMTRDGDLHTVTIPTSTFDTMCSTVEKVDLLKFNIEGGEVYIFNSASFFEKIINFVGEVHGDLIPTPPDLEGYRGKISSRFSITEKYMTKAGRGIWCGTIKT